MGILGELLYSADKKNKTYGNAGLRDQSHSQIILNSTASPCHPCPGIGSYHFPSNTA